MVVSPLNVRIVSCDWCLDGNFFSYIILETCGSVCMCLYSLNVEISSPYCSRNVFFIAYKYLRYAVLSIVVPPGYN
jgi:hypothetical protein